MMFVTVGTHTQSFNRLLKKVDDLVGNGKIKEKVIMQIGNSSYRPKNVEWFSFTSFDRLKTIYKNSNMIITHGGAGSILNGLSNGKPVITVPRLKKFDEHVNDHQLDLVRILAEKGKIHPVYKIDELYKIISKTQKKKKLITKNSERLSREISKFLESL